MTKQMMKTRNGERKGTRNNQRKRESDSEEGGGPVTGAGAVGSGLRAVGEGVERDSGVCGDDLSDLAEAGLGGFVVVCDLERGDHGAADVAYFGVVEDAFEAVADFDPALAVLDGEEHEDAAVGLLFADLPLGEELVGEGFYGFAFGGVDGDDEDLGFGFFVQLAAKGFHVGFALCGEDLGVVVDVAGGGWSG